MTAGHAPAEGDTVDPHWEELLKRLEAIDRRLERARLEVEKLKKERWSAWLERSRRLQQWRIWYGWQSTARKENPQGNK